MWDYVLQMGKTPTITQDIALNPLGVNMDNISGLAYTYAVLGTTTAVSWGSEQNLTNPNYPVYPSTNTTLNNDALIWNISNPGTDSIIYLDFNKEIAIRGISLSLQTYKLAGRTTITVYIEGTRDGTTWETLTSYAAPTASVGTNQVTTISTAATSAKAIRIRCEFLAGASTSVIYFDTLRVWINQLQRFY